MKLGDLTILGPNRAPKLIKALAVIADTLHPAFARQPWMASADKSKESCVLTSLTVRDFLIELGFADAEVRPVVVMMLATRAGAELHSLGIGVPGTPKRDGYWVGHLVAYIPSAKMLIDTTLAHARRPAWRELPGMLAIDVSTNTQPGKVTGLKIIVSVTMTDTRDADYLLEMLYLDNPTNKGWRLGPDAREEWKRAAVLAALRERFGDWRDAE